MVLRQKDIKHKQLFLSLQGVDEFGSLDFFCYLYFKPPGSELKYHAC